MSEHRLSLTFSDADATASMAGKLAPELRPGDVILLSGDVGAGKTHFARSAILQLLTYPEDIPSPTFTLVQSYTVPAGDVWHADLYRLTSTSEIEELGLVDAFDHSVCFVEWPDRLGELAPEQALSLHFEQGAAEDERQVTATWSDPRWDAKLACAA